MRRRSMPRNQVMSVSRFRLLSLAAALGLACPVVWAQTTINLNTANGACVAVTDSAGLTLDTTPGSTTLTANGVSLTAAQEGACDVAGGGPAADFGAELHISGTAATDTSYTPVVGTPFYVVWSATADAQRCTRGGFAATGWTPGTTACTGTACTGRHAEPVTVNSAGQYNFSVTCTNATGYALLPTMMDFPPPATPAPTPNPITLTVPPTATAGAAFQVTWPQMSNAARCVGTGTLAGVNAPNLGDWTSLTTVTTSRDVTVPAGSAAGALQLTLTCWNADDSGSASGTSSNIAVSTAPDGSCPATISTPNGTRTRLLTSSISYGVYPMPVRTNVDLSEWNNIWGHNSATDAGTPWPGVGGASPVLRNFQRTSYVGAHFRTTGSTTWTGDFTNPSFAAGPNMTMAISTVCGDFSQHLPTPGCLRTNVPTADAALVKWKMTSNAPDYFCNLQPNTDYYVNFMFTDPTSTVECPAGASTCMVAPVSTHN